MTVNTQEEAEAERAHVEEVRQELNVLLESLPEAQQSVQIDVSHNGD